MLRAQLMAVMGGKRTLATGQSNSLPGAKTRPCAAPQPTALRFSITELIIANPSVFHQVENIPFTCASHYNSRSNR